MSVRILLADDEEHWRMIVREFLRNEGYEVLEVSNGEQAVAAVRADSSIALVILDLMMPLLDGMASCKEIRAFSQVPVLIVTACDDEESEITSFDCGADEFVSKPIKMRAFMSRVRALLKRATPGGDVLEIAGISINLAARDVSCDGRACQLTPKEYELLLYLAQNKNTARSRQQILFSVWNTEFYGDARTVDTHVKNLRMKLGEYGSAVRTVRGSGYMLASK